MQPDKKKLAERVLKLFALGNAAANQSEAEVQAAITKARELMVEYALTEADLEAVGTSKAKQVAVLITSAPVYTLRQRFALYDDYIAYGVCAITDTDNYIRVKWSDGHRYWQRIFVGTDADVAVAGELFLVLLNSLRQHARREHGPGWSKKHSDYSLGFATRVMQRARQAHTVALPAAQAETMALVVRKKEDARKAFVDKLGLKKARVRRLNVDPVTFEKGFDDAGTVDLGDPRRSLK